MNNEVINLTIFKEWVGLYRRPGPGTWNSYTWFGPSVFFAAVCLTKFIDPWVTGGTNRSLSPSPLSVRSNH